MPAILRRVGRKRVNRPRSPKRRDQRRVGSAACARNIHTLYNFEPPATEDEVHGAALQYVRKVSGFTKPSQANEAAFERAVGEVAEATSRLLAELVTNAPPKDRESRGRPQSGERERRSVSRPA